MLHDTISDLYDRKFIVLHNKQALSHVIWNKYTDVQNVQNTEKFNV